MLENPYIPVFTHYRSIYILQIPSDLALENTFLLTKLIFCFVLFPFVFFLIN